MQLLSALLIVCCCVSAASAQAPQIRVEGQDQADRTTFLVEGRETVIHVPPVLSSGATLLRVELEYRPGSQVSRRVALASLGAQRYSVTPNQAALAKLIASYDTGKLTDKGEPELELLQRSVAIRFAEGLPLGLFVMILAGLILFGGAAFSIRALLRSEDVVTTEPAARE